MQSREIVFVRQILLVLMVAVITSAGCDKMRSVVDDVKASATSDAQPATPPMQAAPSIPAVTPAAATEPTPDQLLAEFRGLKLHEINDIALEGCVSARGGIGHHGVGTSGRSGDCQRT